MVEFYTDLPSIYKTLINLVSIIILGLIVQGIIFTVFKRLGDEQHFVPFKMRLKGPLRYFIPLFLIWIYLPFAGLDEQFLNSFKQAFNVIFIPMIAFVFIRAVSFGSTVFLQQYSLEVADNLYARKIHTQIHYLQRIATVIIIVLAFASLLMSFDKLQQLGASIFASAGLIGIILGLSAQHMISNLLVGIQLAITQPIRLDDVVIIENEWGRIEEISSTYAVVRIWDQRRLIVPLSYFIEKPFQNWTRVSADLIGTVYLYTDYTIPFEDIRRRLKEILEASPYWDKKVCVLQVTNTTERTVELRALVSAADSSAAWTLRCEVREQLITYIQQNYPDCLPKVRARLDEGDNNA